MGLCKKLRFQRETDVAFPDANTGTMYLEQMVWCRMSQARTLLLCANTFVVCVPPSHKSCRATKMFAYTSISASAPEKKV